MEETTITIPSSRTYIGLGHSNTLIGSGVYSESFYKASREIFGLRWCYFYLLHSSVGSTNSQG
ncbi:hypothetical protein KY290_013430 [Solanum tuberosum]|uniref:Uncharacterized protein n=1 Tax=Solanum tuberosum TaxID=4113 RepID=A0ABQ7VLM4_SOLTU|nr:hypothetical protein KY285_012892 [Solanum tuberosum]KAH0769449.1 hypothetical protein KY290_013430 [Solanum tuberosum]